MNGLAEFQHDIVQHLVAFVFSLPRILAAFALLPVFSHQVLAGMTRNGVAASLALLVLPVVVADAPADAPTLFGGLAITLKETLIGLLIGFGAAVPFWAVESVGFFIDNQRGTTMASSLDPMTGSQTSPLGVLLAQVLAVIFFVGGGVLAFLGALYESYRLWPVFSFFPRLDGIAISYFLGLLDRVMALTVLLAAPVIIAMFVAEFAIGLISRSAPQLNVFFLAMPVKSAIGLFILAAYTALLFAFLGEDLLAIATHFAALGALFR